MSDSKFPLGATVAYVTTSARGGRSIVKATVNKVRKDGKFFVSWYRLDQGGQKELVKSDTMWTPIRTLPEARQSGRNPGYTKASIELWSPAHDVEVHEQREIHKHWDNVAKVKVLVDGLKADTPMDRETLRAVLLLLNSKVRTE
jgi:hypothetical protein